MFTAGCEYFVLSSNVQGVAAYWSARIWNIRQSQRTKSGM